jgi:hypothetical protein
MGNSIANDSKLLAQTEKTMYKFSLQVKSIGFYE